jgi:asparagine synthase (glutamine-hydrolysing)
MRHRGPDKEGIVVGTDWALAMCQLRIRSEGSATLPWAIQDLGCIAAYNGEVYGYLNGDGQVDGTLPPGGIGEVDYLLASDRLNRRADGMYSLAWTSTAASTTKPAVELRRDALGIKPLFWRDLPRGQAFSSEVAPLAATTVAPCPIRFDAIPEYLAFGRVLGTRTFYQSVSRVPPGSRLCLTGDAAVSSLTDRLRKSSDSTVLRPETLRQMLRGSVERCLASDRPLGLAVSGGLDSAILAFELNAMGIENLSTVSVLVSGFEDGIESLEALRLPHGGAWTTWKHRVITVSPNELPELLVRSVRVLGEPTCMTSVPLYLKLAQAARESGIVVLLTGEGADELFAGYPSYADWLGTSTQTSLYNRLLEFAFPSERRKWLSKLLGSEALQQCYSRFRETYGAGSQAQDDSMEALRNLELSLSLEPLLLRTDHCLMRESIEGRTPFLHGGVVEAAMLLPKHELVHNRQTKVALRRAWQEALPPQLAWAEKRAFRAPITQWFATSLANWVSECLRQGASAELLRTLGFRPAGLEELVTAVLGGSKEAARLAYGLLSLQSWLRWRQEAA